MSEIYDRIDLYLLGQLEEAERQAFEKELASNARLRQDLEARRLLIESIKPFTLVQEAEASYWEEQSELIDKYLHQEMSLEERTDFEKRLKWDAELRDRLQTQRLIMNGIRIQAAEQSIASIEAEKQKRVRRTPFILKFAYGAIAAAACLFLVVIPAGHFVAKNYGYKAFETVERAGEQPSAESLNKELAVMLESPDVSMEEINSTIYELASLQLAEGDIPAAKKTLDLYWRDGTPRYISPMGEKIIDLKHKLWWIIW